MSTKLTISDMACGGCEDTVVEALENVAGVESATADHESGTATVEGSVSRDSLVAAVEDAGYEVAQ